MHTIPCIPYKTQIPYHTIPYIALHHTVTLDCATLYYITPCYVAFCYITLRYVTLHYIALRSTTLHCKPIPPTKTRYMIVQGKYITLRCLAWHTHIQNSTCTHTQQNIHTTHAHKTCRQCRQTAQYTPAYLPTYLRTYIHISIHPYKPTYIVDIHNTHNLFILSCIHADSTYTHINTPTHMYTDHTLLCSASTVQSPQQVSDRTSRFGAASRSRGSC